jgi:hypothetical protein
VVDLPSTRLITRGQPREERTKRTSMILECRERETTLVTQRAQQIRERVIAR